MDNIDHKSKIKSYLEVASQLQMGKNPLECSRNLINLFLYLSFECDEFVKLNDKFRVVVISKGKELLKELKDHEKKLPPELFHYTEWILNYTLEKYDN